MFGNILINQAVEFSILDRLTRVARVAKETTEEIRRWNYISDDIDILTEDQAKKHIKTCVSNACYDAERLLEALQKIRGL